MIRFCPRCRTPRPVTELVCAGAYQGAPCRWSLLDILPTEEQSHEVEREQEGVPTTPGNATPPQAPAIGLHCRNGHALAPGDFLCMECGETAATVGASQATPQETVVRLVKEWTLGEGLAVHSGESDLHLAQKDGITGVFKHYRRGIEPEASLYPALRTLEAEHGVRLLDAGRYEDRAFEVWEYLPLGTLGEFLAQSKADSGVVREIVSELGRALHGLSQIHLIHRDLKPANVLVRTREPMDLVLSDFSTATISEFDLQLTVSRQTTRYAAPETIAGTCSAASDWWSLGVMVLEMLTGGREFEGVHDRAFLLHLVTRGLRVPADLPEEWQELLKGLLTRDPSLRWNWLQVERWLQGERGIPHGYADDLGGGDAPGITLTLGRRTWPTPESFALAAAEVEHWDEAKDILQSGRLATWLQERGTERDLARAAVIRDLTADTTLPEDARLAAAVMALNENLPLCLRGEVVTPHWVLSHPEIAWQWLDSHLPQRLRQQGREVWFVRLRERSERIRARIQEHKIEFDEAQLSAAMLATSQSMLEDRWVRRRKLYPEADHPALASIMQRRNPTEEDLILLVAANITSFRPASDILEEATKEAYRAQVSFSAEKMGDWFAHSRSAILSALDQRLRNFVRCGREISDQWADDFRQDRRIALARALVLLSIPGDEWREPPMQEYVRNVLRFFHRRMVNGLQRGGLVRMLIGPATARLDLTELGSPARSASDLLNAILRGEPQMRKVDPAALLAEPNRERRLRRLVKDSSAYHRDTGINPLVLGFPFIVLRDARSSEAAKPRIAPVLLWPVKIEMPTGQNATVSICADESREMRINPALQGMLGAEYAEWSETLNDLRSRDISDFQMVLDALSHLTTSLYPVAEKITVRALPPAIVEATPEKVLIHPAAVLFRCDFTGQTLAEDLQQLANGTPLQGTALEMAIRAGGNAATQDAPEPPAELDRYFTASSDPSQEDAVFRARHAPGRVVQGPPGTGKSQTIVNMVCDAIGRGERVLIVCQKQPALDVVKKRLDMEGLGERVCYIKDTTRDRLEILGQIRQQLLNPTESTNDHARLHSEREGLANTIEALENELNQGHQALHIPPPNRPGHLSYREVLDKLLEIEADALQAAPLPGIGRFFRELHYASAERVIAEMAPLTPLWLKARYEDSPLHGLGNFRTDDDTLFEFKRNFAAFQEEEQRREVLLRQHEQYFDIDTPELLHAWLAEHGLALRALPPTVAKHLAQWRAHFSGGTSELASPMERFLRWIESLDHQLRSLDGWTLDDRIYPKLAGRGDRPLQDLSQEAARLATPASSFFGRLSPSRFFARKRLYKWLRTMGVDPDDVDLQTLHQAAELESATRNERSTLKQWCDALGLEGPKVQDPLPAIYSLVRQLIERVRPVVATAKLVQECPIKMASEAIHDAGDPAICASVLDACQASLDIWAAAQASQQAVEKLNPWYSSDWIQDRLNAIRARKPTGVSLERIVAAFPTLPSFLTFRLRAKSLNPTALEILAQLRTKAPVWEGMSAPHLVKVMMISLQRESLLEWKAQIEEEHPSLLMERDEFEDKVSILRTKESDFRSANRRLLSRCPAGAPLASRGDWDHVTPLQGSRSRRLREVVERGEALGLFHLRPVWMVNPELVSRVFPLRPALFDLVIFDEASQLPVENAAPALFRARRAVVSGDEKQMPPSRYFGAAMDDDDGEGADSDAEALLDADDGNLDEDERERLAQALDRREVKDCPDLLTLAQSVLPPETLEIHYRSKYRELIDFSNAAFYGNRLSVPARHPQSEILRVRPVEVDRVDGEYVSQTNEDEAARVVYRLQEIWRQPRESRPSIGVVTFNIKQAELIEQEMETLAEHDPAFRQAWIEEEKRQQNGEDMGFFVKNLENVQGDERDWIIFSTTFGPDRTRVFRRNFGVLGQRGGERRLNVAITRAREKVLVITSMPVDRISTWARQSGSGRPVSPRDFLQAWLMYAESLHAGNFTQARAILSAVNSQAQTDRAAGKHSASTSRFIEEVGEFIREAGHEPVPARGDAFGLDFAIKHPETGLFGLGIECDSHDHAALTTARARELWRPSVLMSSVGAIHRVSSRGWYHHRSDEQNRLRCALEEALKPQTVALPSL